MDSYQFPSQYLAKIAEDTSSSDTFSNLATLGGVVGGGAGGAVAGSRLGEKMFNNATLLKAGIKLNALKEEAALRLQRLTGKLSASALKDKLINLERDKQYNLFGAKAEGWRRRSWFSDAEDAVNRRTFKRTGGLAGGLLGSVALGTIMHSLTSPGTRAKVAKLFDK